MTSITRSGDTPAPSSTPEKSGNGEEAYKSDIEPPFTDYEKQYKRPYLVDHFKIGEMWQDKLGGFEGEIKSIESYFADKISAGEMKNEIGSVKEKLNSIYKLCNIDKTERTTMQIEKLAAYIDFLRKTDDIKLNHTKYGRQT